MTDVSAVTGFPEMLDGRVKTYIRGPRRRAWRLANADHRAQLAAATIEPFELVVVNLYRFAEAAARPGIEMDELIEEIDIGGPTLVRAAAKNHANVAIVSNPGLRRTARGAACARRGSGRCGRPCRRRVRARRPATTRRSRASFDGDARGAERFLRGSTCASIAASPRYGENPHQAARSTAAPDARRLRAVRSGARRCRARSSATTTSSMRPRRPRIARDLRGAAAVVVKTATRVVRPRPRRSTTHGNWRCQATRERVRWRRRDSRHGGRDLATALTSLFLEVVVAAGFEPRPLEVLAPRRTCASSRTPSILARAGRARPSIGRRRRLVTESDVLPDDPPTWKVVTSRAPSDRNAPISNSGWRIARRVSSNAIVLVKEGTWSGLAPVR